MATSDRPNHLVHSLERGLAVLRSFSATRTTQSLSEVAEVTGLDRATARRFLLTLVDLGYVEQSDRTFRLSTQILELGYPYLSGLTVPEVAEPHIQRMVRELNESSSVSVLDRGEVVCVARGASRRLVSSFISVGTRFPAYATSLGRVLLAGLSDPALDDYLAHVTLTAVTPLTVGDVAQLRSDVLLAREQGYAIVDQELEEGLIAVAVPIRDRAGVAVAGVNVSSHTSRSTAESLRRDLLPSLLATAAAIEKDLRALPGVQPPLPPRISRPAGT